MLLAGLSSAALLAGALVCLAAGAVLVIGSAHTHAVFAWPVGSPVAAASMGATLLAGAALLQSGGVAERWAPARLSLLVLLVATIALAGASALGRHDFAGINSDAVRTLPMPTIVAAVWWIGVVGLAVLTWAGLLTQSDRLAHDASTRIPLAGWARGAVGLLGGSVLAVAAVGYAAPRGAAAHLPFPAGSLDVRVLAALHAAIGVSLLYAAWCGDLQELRGGLFGLAVYVAVQAAALIWYHHQVAWSRPAAAVLVAYLAALAITTVVGGVLAARTPAGGAQRS